MTIITNTALVARRISEAQRRRDALRDKREQASTALPEWALLPLRMAGMSAAEIEQTMRDQAQAESTAGVDELDQQIEQVEGEIERIESQMLEASPLGLDGIATLLRLAVDRLHEKTVTDTQSVFYDFGDARLLALVERAEADLGVMLEGEQRRAG